MSLSGKCLSSWGESSEQTVESGETKFPIRLCVKCSTDFLPPGGHNKSVKSGYFRPFVTFHISESRRPKSEHLFNKYYVAWVLKKIRSNRPVKSKIKRNRRNRPILFLLFAHLTRPRLKTKQVWTSKSNSRTVDLINWPSGGRWRRQLWFD